MILNSVHFHVTGRPPSAADAGADVQNPYGPTSSKGPACLRRLLPTPSCPQLPLGCSSSRTSLKMTSEARYEGIWPQEIALRIMGCVSTLKPSLEARGAGDWDESSVNIYSCNLRFSTRLYLVFMLLLHHCYKDEAPFLLARWAMVLPFPWNRYHRRHQYIFQFLY